MYVSILSPFTCCLSCDLLMYIYVLTYRNILFSPFYIIISIRCCVVFVVSVCLWFGCVITGTIWQNDIRQSFKRCAHSQSAQAFECCTLNKRHIQINITKRGREKERGTEKRRQKKMWEFLFTILEWGKRFFRVQSEWYWAHSISIYKELYIKWKDPKYNECFIKCGYSYITWHPWEYHSIMNICDIFQRANAHVCYSNEEAFFLLLSFCDSNVIDSVSDLFHMFDKNNSTLASTIKRPTKFVISS